MKRSRTTPDFPAWSHRLGPMKARLGATGLRLRQTTLSQLETRPGNCLPGCLLAKPAAGPHSRDRIDSLSRTFWGWLWQMLNPNASGREVVRQVQALCALQGGPLVDEDTGGYCQARAHLPQPLLEKALAASARTARAARAGPVPVGRSSAESGGWFQPSAAGHARQPKALSPARQSKARLWFPRNEAGRAVLSDQRGAPGPRHRHALGE